MAYSPPSPLTLRSECVAGRRKQEKRRRRRRRTGFWPLPALRFPFRAASRHSWGKRGQPLSTRVGCWQRVSLESDQVGGRCVLAAVLLFYHDQLVVCSRPFSTQLFVRVWFACVRTYFFSLSLNVCVWVLLFLILSVCRSRSPFG